MSPQREPPWIRTVTVCLALLAACGGGGSGPAASTTTVPQPIAGDIEADAVRSGAERPSRQMVRRASGLYVQDLTMGTGAFASRGRTAVVRYTGWRADGKQFDEGEITVTLGTNKTIAAWEEGLLGMRVGGKRRLVVAAESRLRCTRRGERHSAEHGARVRDDAELGLLTAKTGGQAERSRARCFFSAATVPDDHDCPNQQCRDAERLRGRGDRCSSVGRRGTAVKSSC